MQGGNIHCHINNVSQKADKVRDRSAIAAASYNAGVELFSDKEQRHILVRDEDRVTFDEIIAPSDYPDWVFVRSALWNAVEAQAKRADARLAKKIEVAFARDITPEFRVVLLRDFAASFAAMGCVVDVAIHADDEDHNPHAHLLLTTRSVENGVFGAKIKALDQRKFITDTRARWAALSNKYLNKSGSALRVDHRSYKARGIGLEPTQHRGPYGQQREHAAEQQNITPAHEHAARDIPLKEMAMTEPSQQDKRDYPQLTERTTWPPAREAAPDMSRQERDEHQRYWQEQDAYEVQQLANDFDQEHDVGWPELHADRPEIIKDKFTAAIERATADVAYVEPAEQQPTPPHHAAHEHKPQRDFRAERSQYSDDVYRRALEMKRTPRENELLALAKGARPEIKEAIRDEIIGARMAKVQTDDRLRRFAELEKAMNQAERAKFGPILDPEQDLPEPGAERELLPKHEAERVRQEAVQAERERAENAYWDQLEQELEHERER